MDYQLKAKWGVVGHERILKLLEKSLENQSFSHAYLFVGPKLVGKTTVARNFSRFIACEKYKHSFTGKKDLEVLGCGVCNNCRSFDKGIFADHYLLERERDEKSETLKQNITVRQMRELQNNLSKRSFQNSYKTVLIPEAEKMSEGASNSLLKFLEEPTLSTVIILMAPSIDLVLPTILSRCQVINFSLVAREKIYQYLITQGVERDVALEMASLAQGRPTLVEKFLHDTNFYRELKEQITFWVQIFSDNNWERYKKINQLTDKKFDREQAVNILNILSSVGRDALLLDNQNERYTTNLFLRSMWPMMNKKKYNWKDFLLNIEQARDYLNRNVTPKFILENLFIK